MKTAAFAAFIGYAAAQQAPAYGDNIPTISSTSSSATAPPGYGTTSAPVTTTYACNPAHDYPAGQLCTTISGELTLVTTTATSTSATSTSSCAAPGSTDSQGRYSCNPAHQYPAGQTCVYVGGCLVLVTATTSATSASSTPSCPAAGTTDSQGRYSCNPAHQYPAGQTCQNIGGCPVLVTATSSTTAASSTSPTTSCPAAGTTDSQGRYSCNPAHQYPAGQTCQVIGGCPVLVTATTSTIATPSATLSCPAAGTTDSQGRYSCNPAHQYPAGQTCQVISGCPVLVTATTSTIATPSATPSCPAAGTTDSQGRYSCNPAHQYPAGQTCQNVGGCPVLVNATTSTIATPSATPSCPAAGTTDSQGRYSCNPAHDYPEGQKCELLDGCYFLVGSDIYTTKVVTSLTTYCPQPTTFTHQQKTYTVTKATMITLPCNGGCNVTTPVTSSPPQYTTPIIVKPWTNTTVQQPPSYTTKVVTSLTTYCPQPTTFTHQQSTYTITRATTLTLPCQGGCTVTVSQPPVYTTEVKTALTTYCPEPTTITHQQSTYTVTQPTTLTLPCQGGCTVTKAVTTAPAPSAIPSCPASGSTDQNGRYSCNPAHAYPVGQTCQLVDGCYYLVTPPSSSQPVQPYAAPSPSSYPVQPTAYTAPPPAYPTQSGSSSIVSQPSATLPGVSTTSLTPYTGAAAPMKTGGSVVAAMAIGALFF